MRRVHVFVSGIVQGVGYRYSLRMVAAEHGVTGWTRNRRDGSVEAEIQGLGADVDAVLAWMSEGPPGAHVDAARVHELSPASGDDGFEVRASA